MATHKSSQEWAEILAAYENRNITQDQFCAEHGISTASLHYHRRKHKSKHDKPMLIELSPPAQLTGQMILEPDCRLEVQNSVLGQLKISCAANQLGQIVKELSNACNHDLA